MFQVTSNGPNRLDLEFSGKLDSNEMKTALDDLISKSQDIEHGKMFYRIQDFDIPTLGAIGVEFPCSQNYLELSANSIARRYCLIKNGFGKSVRLKVF